MFFSFPPDFHFKFPYFGLGLMLLVPFWGLFIQSVRYKRRADALFYQSHFDLKKEVLSFFLLSLSFTALILSLMEPEGFLHTSENALLSASDLEQPLPLLFLWDNSLSMATLDAPFHKTREDEAKEIISFILTRLPPIPKALYTFNDHLQPIIPATLDANFLNLTLDALSPTPSENGTDFLLMFKELKEILFTKEKIKPRQIILLTDGEDTHPYPDVKSIEALAAFIGSSGITLHVIGVGSLEGAEIPDITYQGKPVISHLNEPFLIELSRAGGGAYYNSQKFSTLNLSESLLANLEATTYKTLYLSRPSFSYTPLYPLFLWVAAILFFLAGVLPKFSFKEKLKKHS